MAHSGHIIDADFKVVVGSTVDAVELDARTVERARSSIPGCLPDRAPAFTTMVLQQIFQDRRALSIRRARRAKARRFKRWAIAFGAAVVLYVASGGFGLSQLS